MNSTITRLLFGLLSLVLFERCHHSATKVNNHEQVVNTPTQKIITESKIDSIINKLKTTSDLTRSDILELNVVDTTYTNASAQTISCDTTVQLSDSTFYSIISLSDTFGICSHLFIVTINDNTKKATQAQYLEPNCDVDYSSDSYDLYDYKVITKYKIKLTKTTVFQKENRTSNDEDENIDHKQTAISYFNISSTGQIKITKK